MQIFDAGGRPDVDSAPVDNSVPFDCQSGCHRCVNKQSFLHVTVSEYNGTFRGHKRPTKRSVTHPPDLGLLMAGGTETTPTAPTDIPRTTCGRRTCGQQHSA
ncbi:hypothetical protein J6590_087284 [Homalodisca vitripennis]|nr:hypothetical protein J6590_087284 [Homalodisca vitripennis]